MSKVQRQFTASELAHVPLPSELAAASQASDEGDPTEEAIASNFYSPRVRPTHTLFSRVGEVFQQHRGSSHGVRQLAPSSSLKHLMLVGEKAARSPDVPRWDLPER